MRNFVVKFFKNIKINKPAILPVTFSFNQAVRWNFIYNLEPDLAFSGFFIVSEGPVGYMYSQR